LASASRSQWERQQAAARRELERQAREQARLAKERERAAREKYLAAQQDEAASNTAAVNQRIATLDQVLTGVLALRPVGFEKLKIVPRIPHFDAGPLASAESAPDWNSFAPYAPGAISRMFGGASRHDRRVAEARVRFEQATAEHRQREANRLGALADAKARHDREVESIRAEAATHNSDIDTRHAEFDTGDADAVEWLVEHVLGASSYPDGFPRRHQVAYRPENRDVVVEFELPPQTVIPVEREFRFVKSRDAIDPVARPQSEIKQRYANLIACVALRTLHEIFGATPGEIVDAVMFNGRVSTIDKATGKPARPHLLSVSADRATFADLVLESVQPAACLKRLNALVSPNPFDLEAVEPFIEFDLKRFRFTDDLDVVSGLDARPNLLKLTPTEFEHLVRQLFIAMGAEAWTTLPSKDGGVDGVATSKNLFFGGVCLIQAKRWTGVVGLESVHALTGVMADHNATTGVLVTTSWFGRASEQFAKRNRITLINGAELKQLIKQYLAMDVLPGTSPPRRLQPSDNTQTGRPGPVQ
jgi:restriction system protein